MSKLFRRATLTALAAAVMSIAGIANAAPVYVQLDNSGTETFQPPLTITNVSGPYGSAMVNSVAGNLVITFSPTSAFKASANGSGGGHEDQFDGHISFTLTFDAPMLLNPIINEGGNWHQGGSSLLGVTAGGTVTENDDASLLQIGQTLNTPTFVNDNTWNMAIGLGSFQKAYKSYTFSIDNTLDAIANGNTESNFANICKTTFTITIPGGSGGPNATPLPAAVWATLALLPFLYIARKRLA